MTRRTYINILLLALILPISELHTLWEGSTAIINPWIHYNYPLGVEWYIKFLSINVSDLLKAIIIFRVSRMNRVFRIAANAFMACTLFDFMIFFVNMQTGKYYIELYSLVGVITIISSTTHRRRYKAILEKDLKGENI